MPLTLTLSDYHHSHYYLYRSSCHQHCQVSPSSSRIIETSFSNKQLTFFSSTTTTITVTHPQATYYAACDPSSNQISEVDGYGIDTVEFVGATNILPSVDDAYDCCVACIQDPNCGSTATVDGLYNLFYPDPTCQGPNTFAWYYYGGENAKLSPGEGFTVSDGNCGQVAAAGTD